VKKTTIYLGPDLDGALERYAAERGISKSEAVRRAITQMLPRERRPQPRITAIGVGKGPGDLSANDERYLAEGGFGRD
jgi:predicted transcriptional regulator